MAKVIPGRYTAQTDEPFVVFMIGMRINRLLKGSCSLKGALQQTYESN
jgi:hypothetical protein